LRQDRYQQAAGHLHRALALCRETGYRFFEAEALTTISGVCLRQGRLQEATGHLRAALALYREIGNRSGEADALNCLGQVFLADGRPADARAQYTAAAAAGKSVMGAALRPIRSEPSSPSQTGRTTASSRSLVLSPPHEGGRGILPPGARG
jgi:tetratricopeptide (TPR) repeat protein